MTRSASVTLKACLVLCTMAPLAACGMRTPSAEMMGAGRGESFRVGYSVRCRQCRVYYTNGLEQESVEVSGAWNKTVRIRNTTTGMVVLSASPTNSPGYVERAYIEVDGEIVAESRSNNSGTFSGNVDLTAPLVKRR